MSENERTVYVFLGATPVGGPMTELQAYPWLVRNQNNSVDFALRHGGYSVRTVGDHEGVCATPLCVGQAVRINAWELPGQFYRCESCHELIVKALPVFSEDGALSRDDYDALVETVLAMNRDDLTAVRDTFAS